MNDPTLIQAIVVMMMGFLLGFGVLSILHRFDGRKEGFRNRIEALEKSRKKAVEDLFAALGENEALRLKLARAERENRINNRLIYARVNDPLTAAAPYMLEALVQTRAIWINTPFADQILGALALAGHPQPPKPPSRVATEQLS